MINKDLGTEDTENEIWRYYYYSISEIPDEVHGIFLSSSQLRKQTLHQIREAEIKAKRLDDCRKLC